MEIKVFKLVHLRWLLAVLAGAVVLFFLYLFRSQLLAIFTPFVVALGIAYILNPVVVWLQQHKVSRSISVLIIYFVFFGLFFILIARLIPVVIAEINRLIEYIPRYTQQAKDLIVEFNEATDRMELPESVQAALDTNLRTLENWLLDTLTRIPQLTTDVARGVFNAFLILILTFYFLKDFNAVKEWMYRLIPHKSKHRARKILHEIDHSLGNYIRGQLLICTIIGVSTYLGLLFLGVDFALILGIVAGITNIIPYFGPFIGAVPAVLVALLKSPVLAIKVAVVITLIQQVESHLIAPQILGRSMGMHPLVVILTLIAGGQFFGILGMILAVPVAAIIRILLRNLLLPPVQPPG